MQDLKARREDRKKREIERIKSGDADPTTLSNHAGEAQDPVTGENLGDGTGKEATQGANGNLSTAGRAGVPWPTTPAADANKPTDPTA